MQTLTRRPVFGPDRSSVRAHSLPVAAALPGPARPPLQASLQRFGGPTRPGRLPRPFSRMRTQRVAISSARGSLFIRHRRHRSKNPTTGGAGCQVFATSPKDDAKAVYDAKLDKVPADQQHADYSPHYRQEGQRGFRTKVCPKDTKRFQSNLPFSREQSLMESFAPRQRFVLDYSRGVRQGNGLEAGVSYQSSCGRDRPCGRRPPLSSWVPLHGFFPITRCARVRNRARAPSNLSGRVRA